MLSPLPDYWGCRQGKMDFCGLSDARSRLHSCDRASQPLNGEQRYQRNPAPAANPNKPVTTVVKTATPEGLFSLSGAAIE
jgi:hypothetical protein